MNRSLLEPPEYRHDAPRHALRLANLECRRVDGGEGITYQAARDLACRMGRAKAKPINSLRINPFPVIRMISRIAATPIR
jgi:hypothetical protein